MMRSLRPMASLSLSTAMSMSFIRNGFIRSASCGWKKRFAAGSVVMPRCNSSCARMGLMPSFVPNSSASCLSFGIGGV